MKITESELKSKVYRITERILREFDADEYDEDYGDNGTVNAEEQFFDSGCQNELNQRYPDMSFDFEVSDDGLVKVIDTNTGEYYTGKGEIEYEPAGLGYGSSYDSYDESEGAFPYYDYFNCLATIMKKIDENQPDGIESGYGN